MFWNSKNRGMNTAMLGLGLASILGGCGRDGSPLNSAAAQSLVESPRTPNIVPPDIVQHIKSKGNVVDTGIATLYQARQVGDLAQVLKTPHLAYGTDPRQFVDVFSPGPKPNAPVPVIVFIHGGGFTRGDVSTPGFFQYDNIGKFFARNGYIFVNVEYRLAPQFMWPAGGQDFASAIDWTRKHIAAYGGNPKQIFVMGHSAGGAHAAHYTFDTRIQVNGGNDGVIGSILLSPVVGYDNIKNSPAYYGTAPTPDMAPLNHVNERKIPVFIGFAQYDPQPMQVDIGLLFSALCARDKQCPAVKMAQQHSHISEVFHINTADDTFGSDLLTFIREISSRS
jgi:acetyl esterase